MTDLEQFKQTYITECYELLGDMEARLMALDPASADREQLDAIFRCAHSIKGGSGAFGLDYITHFTHVLEALLDSMREGQIAPTREVVDTLLKAADIVTRMVDAARDGEIPPANLGQEVMAKLQTLVHGESAAPATATATAEAPPTEAIAHRYTIRFLPHESLFATGNEPLLLLRELARMGEADITALTDRVPPLTDLFPTQCHLGWIISLTTEKPESAIREVFEFVEDHPQPRGDRLPDLPSRLFDRRNRLQHLRPRGGDGCSETQYRASRR